MLPGEWTFFRGSWIHICVKCKKKDTHVDICICVCVCVHTYVQGCVRVLCQTVTSCSPELKVHLQQNREKGVRSRVCRMPVVYTHMRAQERALNNTYTCLPACLHTHTIHIYTVCCWAVCVLHFLSNIYLYFISGDKAPWYNSKKDSM